MIPLQDTQSQVSIPTRPPPEVSNWWPTGCIWFINVFYLVCTQLLFNLLAAHFFFFNECDSILKFWVFALLAKSEEVNIMVKIRRLLSSSLPLPVGGYFPVSHSLYSSLLSDLIIHLLCSSGSWMHLIFATSDTVQCIWEETGELKEKSKSPSFNTVSCVDLHRILCSHIDIPPRLWRGLHPPSGYLHSHSLSSTEETRSASCKKPASTYTRLSWPRPFLHMIGWATEPVPFPWPVIALGVVMSGDRQGEPRERISCPVKTEVPPGFPFPSLLVFVNEVWCLESFQWLGNRIECQENSNSAT